MKITALHLHPIKGCHRVEVDRAVASPYGLVGDREWQVVDADGFVTQRRHPRLALVHPTIVEGGIVVRASGMPDLEVATPPVADRTSTTYSGVVQVGDGGDAAAKWFSEHLRTDVRLVGMAPGYVRRDPELFATESNLGDVAPVLVANDASHAFLAERAVEPFGPDRWRANIWIDAAEPWVEDTWRVVRAGDATITLVLPWPRCAVPQVDQDDGTRHREPALALKQHRWCTAVPDDAHPVARMMLPGSPLFGVGASIEPVGATIAVGDEVVVVETGPALL